MGDDSPKKIERRGGARPNTGGPRPNSGPKRKVIPFYQCEDRMTAENPPLLRDPGKRTPKPLPPDEQRAIVEQMAKGNFDPNSEGALDFLKRVYRAPEVDLRQRIAAAQIVLRMENKKQADKGKKQQRQDAAEDLAEGGDTGTGKFKTPQPPKLVANGG